METASIYPAPVTQLDSSVPENGAISEFKVITSYPCPHKGERLDQPELFRDLWCRVIVNAPWYDPNKEALVMFALNTRYRLLGFNLIALGNLNECVAHPREIIRPLLVASAYAGVLMHNHPSGDATPSRADRAITTRLQEAMSSLNLELLDHVIIGEKLETKPDFSTIGLGEHLMHGYYSMRETGLL